MLPADAGLFLIPIARATIGEAVGQKAPPMNSLPDWLQEEGACFVTLNKFGELRGCIGTIEAYRPLLNDVKANAVAAAMRDPRFTPLRQSEFHEIDIEVSVLSILEPMSFVDEADALSQMRAGVDGLVIRWRSHRGVFLPQVWEDLPDPRDFLQHLKRKAGLPVDFWAADVNLSRYTVSKWQENENS